MINLLKKFITSLPSRWQQGIKRNYYSWQIRHNRFNSDEKEYDLIERYISPGDWVLDIGANIGHYTAKFSFLVGNYGRVIAIEPVPKTFELLAANTQLFPHQNVTLLNIAGSNQSSILFMEVPDFDTGIKNYYRAHISQKKTDLMILSFPIDFLPLNHRIKLVKIDTEGHEFSVLKGMTRLLDRDHPVLIVETYSKDIIVFLKEYGYMCEKLEKSPNYIFQHESTINK